MTGLLNSFQVFNIYIDRAMELLTDSEFRVLMYATRHITGWQDRIDERQGCISISMFEKGFTTNNGAVFAGCGLSRQTIINAIAALVEFGFLERTGRPTAKGQKYTLETKGIEWYALEKRRENLLKDNRDRTSKATKSRRVGTLDVTGTSDDTMRGTLDVTMLSTLDVTQTKTTSKTTSKTSLSADADVKPPKVDPIFDAVAYGSFGLKKINGDKQAGARIGKIASWLKKQEGVTAERIQNFYFWYDRQTDNAPRPRDIAKFAEWFLKFHQQQAKPKNITNLDPALDLSIQQPVVPMMIARRKAVNHE